MEEELEAVDNVIEMYYMMFVQIQNDMNDLESNLMHEINWVNNTVDWAYMDLTGAHLEYADLSNANLSNANLHYAYLHYADLSNANLVDADLSSAVLAGATLNGADLAGVYWHDTTCPDGTNSDNNGYTCVNNL